MKLFYDERDDKNHGARGSRILYWLDDLDAQPLTKARTEDEGFLFAGARPMDDYRRITAALPLLRDRPEDRAPLLRLDTVLDALEAVSVAVPMPRTWRLPLDTPLPTDLTFPLFVRTAISSWKLGGRMSRVKTPTQLEEEIAQLRRAFGWDALILARAWHDLADAGQSAYGPVAQEVRVWIVHGVPFAWSFHYLNVVPNPRGFPPSAADLEVLAKLGREVAGAFRSALVAADFAREKDGGWIFIEAGPGSCAGTGHEAVFKAVARRLRGETVGTVQDAVGGILSG
jgi:hypothetical protein